MNLNLGRRMERLDVPPRRPTESPSLGALPLRRSTAYQHERETDRCLVRLAVAGHCSIVYQPGGGPVTAGTLETAVQPLQERLIVALATGNDKVAGKLQTLIDNADATKSLQQRLNDAVAAYPAVDRAATVAF